MELNAKELDVKDNQAKKLDVQGIFLKYSVYIVLVVLFVYFSFASPRFLTVGNMANFFRQLPSVGILTIGYTMILITGYVDLSIASIAAFAGTLAAQLAIMGVPAPFVILISLLSGAVFGLLNAALILKFDLPSFISTLGMNFIIRGIVMFATNGIMVIGVPAWFTTISTTRIFSGVPIVQDLIFSNTLIFLVLVAVFAYVMKNTRLGKYCYAIGSNTESARLSGIKTNRHVMKIFAIEGTLAALAGILLMSNLNVGAPNEGQGLDLLAMAAAIMGGTQFSGGVGTIGGAVVGIFTLQLFTNGLAIMGVNSFVQQIVTGGVIIFAVIVDFLRRKAATNN